MKSILRHSNDKGSVLMEAVIVFPLYLFLFGALFSIGETTLGNIQLLSAERLASIWGDRRYGFDDSGKNEKLNEHVKSMFNSTPGVGVSSVNAKNFYQSKTANYFSVMTGAAIDASHGSTRASSLMGISKVFFGVETSPKVSLNTADEDHYHFFVMQRWSSSEGTYDRSASAETLAKGALWDIAGDDLPASDSAPNGSSQQGGSKYNRVLGYYAN
ncbi:MAG: hypothetical protein K5787_06300 [Lentisphaeria bacterium]|nr:hypothetical protein [Victivallales bacterium]MCR4573359.1 hypothetical protein [Lentisphaeria bacterium]